MPAKPTSKSATPLKKEEKPRDKSQRPPIVGDYVEVIDTLHGVRRGYVRQLLFAQFVFTSDTVMWYSSVTGDMVKATFFCLYAGNWRILKKALQININLKTKRIELPCSDSQDI